MRRILALAALAAAVFVSAHAPASAQTLESICASEPCRWIVERPFQEDPFWLLVGPECGPSYSFCKCTPPNLVPSFDLYIQNDTRSFITACYYELAPPGLCKPDYCRYQAVQFAYPGPTYQYAWVQISNFCSLYSGCSCTVPNMAPYPFYDANSINNSQVDTFCHN